VICAILPSWTSLWCPLHSCIPPTTGKKTILLPLTVYPGLDTNISEIAYAMNGLNGMPWMAGSQSPVEPIDVNPSLDVPRAKCSLSHSRCLTVIINDHVDASSSPFPFLSNGFCTESESHLPIRSILGRGRRTTAIRAEALMIDLQKAVWANSEELAVEVNQRGNSTLPC
jgi:hypothetical protein